MELGRVRWPSSLPACQPALSLKCPSGKERTHPDLEMPDQLSLEEGTTQSLSIFRPLLFFCPGLFFESSKQYHQQDGFRLLRVHPESHQVASIRLIELQGQQHPAQHLCVSWLPPVLASILHTQCATKTGTSLSSLRGRTSN